MKPSAATALAVISLVVAIVAWVYPFQSVAPSPLAPYLEATETNASGNTASSRRPQDNRPASDDPDRPPPKDPGQQPLPPDASRLGGISDYFESYCQDGWKLHAVVRYQNAWGWRCARDAGSGIDWQPSDQSMSVDDACAERYGKPTESIRSYYTNYHDPYAWSCYSI